MGLINSEPTKVDIPFEPGEWIKLRPLSGREMDQARAARLSYHADQFEKFSAMLSSLPQNGASAAPDDNPESRREAYDPDTLICFAVREWSYTAPITDDPASLLDARTRDWLWTVIVEQNTRPLESSPDGERISKLGVSRKN